MELTALRSNLTPFLKAVTRALSIELEKGPLDIERKHKVAIINEILKNLPAENATSNLCTNLSQVTDTLQDEFDQLKGMNIQ